MRNTRKPFIALLAVALVAALGVGATVAWLTDTTTEVKNTFVVGDIDIDLYEHDYDPTTNKLGAGEVRDAITNVDYKMIPGRELPKDPVVVVKKNSEACWLFVKVNKSSNFDTYMTCAVDSKWTALSGVSGVYYAEVDAATDDQTFNVLKDQKVMVKSEVTKAQMEAAKTSNPTISFTAYAIQKEGINSAADAWTKIFS